MHNGSAFPYDAEVKRNRSSFSLRVWGCSCEEGARARVCVRARDRACVSMRARVSVCVCCLPARSRTLPPGNCFPVKKRLQQALQVARRARSAPRQPRQPRDAPRWPPGRTQTAKRLRPLLPRASQYARTPPPPSPRSRSPPPPRCRRGAHAAHPQPRGRWRVGARARRPRKSPTSVPPGTGSLAPALAAVWSYAQLAG